MVARSENLDQTVEGTTKKSENLDRTVEDTAANCLMLLSRVGEPGGGDGESRVFRCKTCMQGFSSFQALGGHRASHNASHNKRNTIDSSGDEQSSLSSGPVTKKRTKKMRPHRCSICGLEFPTGQALGGHMRKHREKEDSGAGASVTRLFFPEAKTPMFTTLKKSSGGKKVACLDLGSDSSEGTINLKLELGRTIN